MLKNYKLEMAYLAGLFDGEGCITIRRNSSKGKQLALDCALGMTNQYVPNLFQFHFQGSVSFCKGRKENHNNSWLWQISARKALAFLEEILPYLRLKRAEAELAIAFQKRLKWQGGVPVTDAEWAYREAQKVLLHSLKTKKGV